MEKTLQSHLTATTKQGKQQFSDGMISNVLLYGELSTSKRTREGSYLQKWLDLYRELEWGKKKRRLVAGVICDRRNGKNTATLGESLLTCIRCNLDCHYRVGLCNYGVCCTAISRSRVSRDRQIPHDVGKTFRLFDIWKSWLAFVPKSIRITHDNHFSRFVEYLELVSVSTRNSWVGQLKFSLTFLDSLNIFRNITQLMGKWLIETFNENDYFLFFCFVFASFYIIILWIKKEIDRSHFMLNESMANCIRFDLQKHRSFVILFVLFSFQLPDFCLLSLCSCQ